MLAKIAETPELDRTMGERLHAIVKAASGILSRDSRAMPAYAREARVVIAAPERAVEVQVEVPTRVPP